MAWSALLALIAPAPANGQHIFHIGALVANDQFVPAIDGFKKKMPELGYTEGKSVKYDVYNAEGSGEKLRALAQKLVQEKPDLIVTSSTTATAPVAKVIEESNLPVVFLSAGNPLLFVKSYASSGNNLTGITTSSIDLTGKRMELLKELVPGLKRVISVHNLKGENYEANLKATREEAKRLRLELTEVNVSSSDELIRQAPKILNRKLGQAVFFPPDAVLNAAQRQITPQLIRERLPSVTTNLGNVRDGALATYAPDYFALGQQGAVLVDKILRGARPADLPIEQPFELKVVINLKTAKAIGLKIPKNVLPRVNEIIE